MVRSRPASAEMLHGIAANNELVSALGVRPEDEDATIAQEWSPRDGRKQQNSERHGRARGRGNAVGDDYADRAGSGDGDGRRQAVSSPTNVSSSPSRSPLRGCRQQVGRDGTENGKGSRRRRSSTILPVGFYGGTHLSRTYKMLKRSLSHSPTRRRRRRRCDGPRRRSYSSDNDEESNKETYIFGSGGGIGGNEHYIRPSTLFSSNFSLGYMPMCGGSRYLSTDSSCAYGNVENLGGEFELPNSPYRTYRTKLSRIVRARSSERAAAESRQRNKQTEGSEVRWGQRQTFRTRSTDADGRRIRRRRHGASGMTSPLLRQEGFGLLESNVTKKISLGIQLPRDQYGASGRARAAVATAAEKEAASFRYPGEAPASPLRVRSIARRERQQAHRRRAWLSVHHHGESDTDSASGRSEYSTAGGDFNIGERDERGRYPISRHILEAGVRWPSGRNSKRSISAEARYGRGLIMGKRRSRDYGGNDHSSFSWSPPRTRTGAGSIGGYSTEGSGDILNAAQRGDRATGRRLDFDIAFKNIRRRQYADNDGCRSAGNDPRPSSRSPSPLDAPLDPYRASRTVMRAGTLVARHDVVRMERASRKAFVALRAAFKARRQVERESGRNSSSLNFDRSGGALKRIGGMRRDCLDSGGGFTAMDDTWVEEYRLKDMIPSMELMGKELKAIRRADKAMREEQLAQVRLDRSERFR